jgi:organic hydroperoxide reductase OsmC/OhrA
MSEHRATVEWQRSGEFRYETYSRTHELRFDGIAVPGNAGCREYPKTVPPREGVDPEQAFVAALSSCHMLWFLHIAWQEKWVVDRTSIERSASWTRPGCRGLPCARA